MNSNQQAGLIADEKGEINIEALRASESRYRRLFETVTDGILILDFSSGKILEVNQFLINLLGYSREEFLTRKLWEVGPFKDLQAISEAYTLLQEMGCIRYDDLPLQTRDGRLIPVEFISHVFEADDNKLIQCNIRDITNRKQLVEELRKAKEDAENANKAKDRFLGMISHELRTPLNPMNMLIHEWQTEKLFPHDLLSDLEIMRRNLDIETHLIGDLLDATAINLGKFKVAFQRYDVHDVLEYAVETVRHEMKERKLKVLMSLEARNSIVNTDFTRLAQVLWNIIENAVKFTPAGGTVAISTANEDNNLRIIVTDSGIGIPKEIIPRIFEPFERGEHIGYDTYAGLGLGLNIAKNLIELLGGTLTAYSDGPGKGAVFTVMLRT